MAPTAEALAVQAAAHVTAALELVDLPAAVAKRRLVYHVVPALRDAVEALPAGHPARAELAAADAVWWAMAATVERLVQGAARRYNHAAVSAEDAVQEGRIGAFRAAERFDPARGLRFNTQARWWIRAAITRAVDRTGTLVQAPNFAGDWLRNIGQMREHAARSGRTLGTVEAAELLGKSPEIALAAESARATPVSFEAPVDGLDELRVGDTLPAPEWEAEDDVDMRRRSALLAEAVAGLHPRDRLVLEARWSGETLIEVGARLGLSRERARQIEGRALRQIRDLIVELETDGVWL